MADRHPLPSIPLPGGGTKAGQRVKPGHRAPVGTAPALRQGRQHSDIKKPSSLHGAQGAAGAGGLPQRASLTERLMTSGQWQRRRAGLFRQAGRSGFVDHLPCDQGMDGARSSLAGRSSRHGCHTNPVRFGAESGYAFEWVDQVGWRDPGTSHPFRVRLVRGTDLCVS